ncbi:MAG: hypothetical protein A3F82_04670 [Deltaproteobacteria bacterium RIFCSPLOWO2_12_FULL_44_12]|nr:MAG: hypothetical protein A2712_00425 [Deltaproteobacteria bacterium RIFCSPHIGHO2_01_FULL_43_49]OGQ14260.1 MAG: hypothetical protein A3D22_10190 [Deltaproteobacteria bacterium RIFCSPHIGHO2_02_FULL_44_53]OGQ27476.1 MAG: hypothetical protein A3D98_03790 [Deltaproteobacteria bacterium RIFCSPHIGHO2_12_FULL_44_21]OGQ30724.1 MAG: hypothetical protein A2979_06215 [Deltaproteobacteria bacterium RIFCSPLOWO2_01_FULL_45_74]OGQ42401.1 MAG: hypothetical protein A3I70_02700 [Deltaproteobacteria bacterium 
MKFEDYKRLSEAQKVEYLCRSHGDEGLFQKIQEEFLREFNQNESIEVVVGGYGIGEVPAIVVILKQRAKLHLPKSFMGLPVIKRNKRITSE